MATFSPPSLSLSHLSLIFFLIYSSIVSAESNESKTFIIHIAQSHKPSLRSYHGWYASLLRSLASASSQPPAILYTYDRAVRGFSARLSSAQAAELRRRPGVLSVDVDQPRHLHTTRTPEFLGLQDSSGLWPDSGYADDVIVGMLDTGIWPEGPSFADAGQREIPSGWKGVCDASPDFPASACNRKIIGARAFYRAYEAAIGGAIDETVESKSPRDTEGHGSHTASTAAGSPVGNASLFGYAGGEARGMAAKARIAVYKICWAYGCFDSDILAAMDQAIADGVHVISLSVGANGLAPPYNKDSIAIGSFGAMEHGVVVSCSAGNAGPDPFSAVNIAPWILTVGASTLDREFPADVVLGDGRTFSGVSLYAGEPLTGSGVPLIHGGDCGSRYCFEESLDPSKAAGKVVICDRGGNARVDKGSAVKQAGGAGMILANTAEDGEELLADSHLVPATMVGYAAGEQIRGYAAKDPSPTATILFRGTVVGPRPSAPRVAAFSSRGPNHLTPEIIKPDVIAPGVNILAAWTGTTAPTDLDIDPRRVYFNIISGTSMACPHVSGLAALLRKAYPEWSPAAVKSALMTTASDRDNSGHKILDLATGEESSPFVHGAGHVDPNRALDPGLIYDIRTGDYVAFLCASGYSPDQIGIFTGGAIGVDCGALDRSGPGDLNYPSFAVAFGASDAVVNQRRTVTNVGGTAAYEVKVRSPAGVEVVVSPTKLEFSREKQTASYEVTFSSARGREGRHGDPGAQFGAIEWGDGVHVVRSPIAVTWERASV